MNRISNLKLSVSCRFSGMMHGYQCFCGSQYGKAGPSDECKIPCVNDTTSICGSDEAINIYSTGQKVLWHLSVNLSTAFYENIGILKIITFYAHVDFDIMCTNV
ncbi:unnamed protein product [Trichogramma brassicae]|uniref:WSC domain-containing protein n=1 Tax=Trichogramma brassicae TaxID=86971 RepID=A0A6H5IF22_9HYME|nr:unnamed protein product [Trichogramma brassicae]